MKKICGIFVAMLMITMFAAPVLGEIAQSDNSGQFEITTLGKNDVTLDVAITTDWVNDWQDHGLRIREFGLDDEVWAYHEISSNDLFGLYFANPSGTYTKSSGIGVAAAKNAATAPYLLTNLSKGRILFRVFSLMIFLPP